MPWLTVAAAASCPCHFVLKVCSCHMILPEHSCMTSLRLQVKIAAAAEVVKSDIRASVV